MELPKINCHIHSKFSDGSNNIDEIVKKSVKLSMDFISITDHLSNSWKSNLIPTLDNSIKIDTYLKAINKTNLYLEETNQKLRLLKGVEIDISSDKQYILRLINPKEFNIILFEYVESYEGLAFVSNIINYWRRSIKKEIKLPLFGLAHLEPSYFYYGNWG
ncbi:MAG: PHP domain-containing protein [Candidatus Thorarchaeota archaeon]